MVEFRRGDIISAGNGAWQITAIVVQADAVAVPGLSCVPS
jgi:hypothetical protein